MELACAVIGIVLVLCGIALMDYGKKLVKYAKVSQSWPHTEGTIIESRVEVENGETTSYLPVVRYTYTARGKEFTGDEIALGFRGGYGSMEEARRNCDKYWANKKVNVYYHPDNAALCTLEHGVSHKNHGTFYNGVMLLIIGMALLTIATGLFK
jgi:hypothetical protein